VKSLLSLALFFFYLQKQQGSLFQKKKEWESSLSNRRRLSGSAT
jgi:hypothetical protein